MNVHTSREMNNVSCIFYKCSFITEMKMALEVALPWTTERIKPLKVHHRFD